MGERVSDPNWETIEVEIQRNIVNEDSNFLENVLSEYTKKWEELLNRRFHPIYGRKVRNLQLYIPMIIYANTLNGKGRVERKTR